MTQIKDPNTDNYERLRIFLNRIYKTADADVLFDLLEDMRDNAESIRYEENVISDSLLSSHYGGMSCTYRNLLDIAGPILKPERYKNRE